VKGVDSQVDAAPIGSRGGGSSADPHQTPRARLLKPADKVIIAYLVLIALPISIFSYRIDRWVLLLAGHAMAIAVVLLIAAWERARRPIASPFGALASFLRGWYPVALTPLMFKELSYVIPLIHPRDFDTALAAIDHRLLAVHPTVWLEQFTSPPLTDVLQLAYSTYYFLPLILGAVLWRKGCFEEFHSLVFVVMLGFFVSYLGYIAVPAIGPRFLPEIVEAQTKPLTGVWLFQPIRAMLDSAEGNTRDCFPSGHTELTLLVLYYARAFHRKTFWWLLPFGTGIVVSTVYLRYHYVIDVAAGALCAITIILIAKPMYRMLNGNERSKITV
jgi:membrane-associated phospholipid phosphatase